MNLSEKTCDCIHCSENNYCRVMQRHLASEDDYCDTMMQYVETQQRKMAAKNESTLSETPKPNTIHIYYSLGEPYCLRTDVDGQVLDDSMKIWWPFDPDGLTLEEAAKKCRAAFPDDDIIVEHDVCAR